MNSFYIAIRTFLHYLRQNLTVALGVAVSTGVLTGALIIGDSVRHSLEKGTSLRLGTAEAAISGGDRIFSTGLADRLESKLDLTCVPLMQLQGTASADGGRLRIDRVRVNGVDGRFDRLTGDTSGYGQLRGDEVVISGNMAARLNLKEGDFFVLTLGRASIFPSNTPFVSGQNTTVSIRARVRSIASEDQLSRFSIRISQTAPFNVFISLSALNRQMELENRCNLVLICPSSNRAPGPGNQYQGQETRVTGSGTGPVPDPESLHAALKEAWNTNDANLQIEPIPGTGIIELRTKRVFLEPAVVDLIGNLEGQKENIITYFVNAFRFNGQLTPYSFISTNQGIGVDGIRINDWLAKDLGITMGDTLTMEYFVPGPLRKLEERSMDLVVEGIFPLEKDPAQERLMPDLPGLSDAGHCRDWEAGIPIDLENIRDKDEAYWNSYRGTPKAYINTVTAEEIWSNRFGTYTSVRFYAAGDSTFASPGITTSGTISGTTSGTSTSGTIPPGTTPGTSTHGISVAGIKEFLDENLDPADLGIGVEMVRSKGMKAAREGVDFSELFLSLSFFVLLSAFILTILLFRLNLPSRISQAGTLKSLGFPDRLIKRYFLLEGALDAVIGGLPGILLAMVFTIGVFRMLGTLWSDIVRTSILEISILPRTLLTGYLISVALSWLGIWFILKRNMKGSPAGIRKRAFGIIAEGRWIRFASYPAAILSLAFLALGILKFSTDATMYFLIAGFLLLTSMIFFAEKLFMGHTSVRGVFSMAFKNAGRNRQRRLAIILLFALGAYTVVMTGSNRRDPGSFSGEDTGGTGGFGYYAESTVPVLFDLNNMQARYKAGIEGDYRFVQFRKNEGDDASCLNLNHIESPVLLGVDPTALRGRFRFVAGTGELDKDDPWLSLDRELPGGTVPAIADQTVIQWGLGKKAGDSLIYLDEAGDSMVVKLVGGIAPSVLQGNLIISEKNFLRHYPSSSGSGVNLIESTTYGKHEDPGTQTGSVPGSDPESASEKDPGAISGDEAMMDLGRALRDNGWYMVRSGERLAEFSSVQNTYLAIFTMLGVLALLLGTVGLGILLVRDIMDRRSEIGLLQSLGFGKNKIFRLLFTEYFMLIGAGILSGFCGGFLSTFPALAGMDHARVAGSLAWILFILLVNSLLWISLFVRLNISRNYHATLSVE